MKHLMAWLEQLGGSRDVTPGDWSALRLALWGLWWGVLIVMIMVFGGQTSKFIYIDF
jgi:hypothetical protein